jgi:oxygen-independent coproporphyrinogen-3 oxidase
LSQRPLGLYIHVPFCATRCGYCNFVTYTSGELGGSRLQDGFADAAIGEIRLVAAALGPDRPPLTSVFFGGGTPTLLPPNDLISILDAARAELGLRPGGEVTVEANPDSIDRRGLEALRDGGATRVSFGMQSVRRHVLAVLERTHTPGRAEEAVRDAHVAGFVHVNLDLIYGTPGERDDDWRATLEAAIDAGPDHISAYALTVEPRTRLGAQVRHGRVPVPDDDTMADRYAVADELLGAAGFRWYEVSNWARSDDARCAHNLLYWHNDNWLAVGPGAHGHVGGLRWWNVTHPARHAELVGSGALPVEGSERVTEDERALEDLLLGIRLAEGLPADRFDPDTIAALEDDGLVDAPSRIGLGRVVLSRDGRLLTDSVIQQLADDAARASRGSVASPIAP